MKKAQFLPMLAIFTILIVGILGYTFYKNKIKERDELVGEKARFIIKTLVDNEKDNFFVEDSARLAFCDSMENLANKGIGCLKENYPIWSFNPDNCNPDNNLLNSFNKYFDENFKKYLSSNAKLKNLKYTFKLSDDGFSLVSDPISMDTTDEKSTINVKYDFKVDLNKKIASNIKDYTHLVALAKKYRTCINNGKTVDVCNVETKLLGSRSDNLIKFEVSSIKNPCTLQQMNINFVLESVGLA